jgi:hypothetical protein
MFDKDALNQMPDSPKRLRQRKAFLRARGQILILRRYAQ